MAGPPEHFVVFGRKIPRTPSCFDVPGNVAATARGERVYGLEFQGLDELQGLIVSAFINGEMAKIHNGGH